MNSSVFRVITRHKVIQGSSCPAWPLKMGLISSPKTSVLNHLTPYKKTEEFISTAAEALDNATLSIKERSKGDKTDMHVLHLNYVTC